MPRIDPHQLLSCLGVLLNPNGGIRSKDEVQRLASLMTKYSKNLVSKCVYILILKNTDTDLLGRFMSAGGWNLTHLWLTNGIMNKNWALVSELLELMLMCPVDVERLKANNCPKLVKGLSKEGGPEGVRILASKLVEQWLKVVKGETQANCVPVTTNIPPIVQTPHEIIQKETPAICHVGQEIQSDKNDNHMETTSSCETIATQETVPPDSTVVGNVDETDNIGKTDIHNTVSETEPIYRITVRDGKQVIAKVEDSSVATTKVESEEIVIADTKIDKDKLSISSRDKDKSKHSSKHNSSSKSSSSSSSSSSNGRKTSSSHKDKNRDKERDKSKDRDRDKSKSKSSSNISNSSSSSKSRDKDKNKDKSSKIKVSDSNKSNSNETNTETKEKQAEKDKATLAKLQPQSISKLGKIPKKPPTTDPLKIVDDEKKEKKSTVIDPPKIETKKLPSISIENRKNNPEARPKTVKVFNAKMRSTGLEEEVKPPPPRPTIQRKIPPPKRPSPPRDTIKDNTLSHPPEKKQKIVDIISNGGDLLEKSERPGGIKLIAPKPKPIGLQECGLFMDAMVAASVKKEPKKRKRRISISKDDPPGPGGKSSSPPNSPSATASPTITTTAAATTSTNNTVTNSHGMTLRPTAPKFYKDTLELDEEPEEKSIKIEDTKEISSTDNKKVENDDKSQVKENLIESPVKSETTGGSPDIKINDESVEDVKLKREFRIPGGVLVYHKRKGPKKSVQWKKDTELEEIQYFELDETERVNVTKTFTDMKQIEMSGEREALQMSRKLPNEDLMDERTKWRPLIPIDLAPDLAERGKKSKEKDIQYAREKVILQALYFHKSMIPDSPTEPDVEHHQMEDPIIIPLEDATGNSDNIKDFTGTPWPESKGEMPRQQLPPPVPQFPNINQPNFINHPPGPPNSFPPFHGQPNFMGNDGPPPPPHGPPMMAGGDWRTGDGRIMGMPNEMPMPPPNMFNPMGGMPPPNLFPGPPGPDGFNMPPNMNSMNGPPFPGPPVDFQNGPPGPGMYHEGGGGGGGGPPGGFPSRGGHGRGRGRGGGYDRFNNGPNSWKGNRNWNNRGICKHFQKGGYCRQGDKCQFLHPGVNCPPF